MNQAAPVFIPKGKGVLLNVHTEIPVVVDERMEERKGYSQLEL